MKANHKWTVIAMAIATLTASAAASAADNQNKSANIDHQHRVTETRENTNVNTNVNTTENSTANTTVNTTLNLNGNLTENVTYTQNEDYSNVQHDERKEKNNHAVDVNFKKDMRLSSDVQFTGNPTITGNINLDSAAIAIIDNRQSVTNNIGGNTLLTNKATIEDDVGSNASGNLGFNVAAGDNNAQDNAAALSAADASFSFGMADAEVFVNQNGASNLTLNSGVTNTAGLSGNAFSNASGNIAVNATSGNNNEQKNSLAASVATSAYATSSISSNQTSSDNMVTNAGRYERHVSTIDVNLSGSVTGNINSSGEGTYSGLGNAYQANNYYPEIWSGAKHNVGQNQNNGHLDWDLDTDGAVENPYNPGHGGIAFNTDESGTLGYSEVGDADLTANLSGQIVDVQWVAVNATNTASLSGSAFSGASGNIGVNVSAGTGNLQANTLAMAVAQPSTAGGGTGGGTGE